MKISNELGTDNKPSISDFNANNANSLIEDIFLNYMKKCYTNLTKICRPILSNNDITILVNRYKEKLP